MGRSLSKVDEANRLIFAVETQGVAFDRRAFEQQRRRQLIGLQQLGHAEPFQITSGGKDPAIIQPGQPILIHIDAPDGGVQPPQQQHLPKAAPLRQFRHIGITGQVLPAQRLQLVNERTFDLGVLVGKGGHALSRVR